MPSPAPTPPGSARSFSLALKSGVPIEQALTVTAATVDNAFIAKKVEAMREQVERGEADLPSRRRGR